MTIVLKSEHQESDKKPPLIQAAHKKYARGLSPEEKILIQLRDELYNASWDRMLTDLRSRLERRPYIFKLVSRIEDDIRRIEKLKEYEEKNNINLAEFLKDEIG